MAKKKVNGDTPVTLELLTQFYKDHLKPHFLRIEKKIDRNANKIEENSVKIEAVDVKVDKLADQFEGLKAEFAETPTRKEFNQLKAKVLS